jgi:hypothetical protein
MRNLTIAFMALAVGFFCTGSTGNAYLPGSGVVTALPAVVSAGAEVTVRATCATGETVMASLVEETSSAVCGAKSSVEIIINAPAAAGYFEGPVIGSANGVLGSFNVTVPEATTAAAALPESVTYGSTIVTLAVGLFVVGAVLFGLSLLRRRKSAVLFHPLTTAR